MASWLSQLWNHFPHLGITSPEKRCGKSRLLELLQEVCPNAQFCNASRSSIFRSIEADLQAGKTRPTLLIDEAQCLSRGGSESAQELREMFCASISKKYKMRRSIAVGRDFEPKEFATYCPKVIALIGDVDGVLADRCLPVRMKRRKANEKGRRFFLSEVEKHGGALRTKLDQWAKDEGVLGRVSKAYRTLEPFDIDNDRMAELLLPLQAVLHAEGQAEALEVLEGYARGIEEADREAETQSPGVRLLSAIRDIFACKEMFLSTSEIISQLPGEELWRRWHGFQITPEAVAGLLRPFGIKPVRNKQQTCRGYYAWQFRDAWARYLPAVPGSNPSNPSSPSRNTAKGGAK